MPARPAECDLCASVENKRRLTPELFSAAGSLYSASPAEKPAVMYRLNYTRPSFICIIRVSGACPATVGQRMHPG